MSSRVRTTLWILCSAILLALLLPPGRAISQEIQRVLVTNIPEVQRILGTVSVEGPVRHGRLQSFPEIVVPPVEPTSTRRLIPGGTLAADGFTSVVLSLGGQFKLRDFEPGTVGAILIPEEDPILRAFEENGKILFPLEISSTAGSPLDPYFASSQEARLGFPRYRVFLYNTSDRAATVILFAYLRN